MKSLSAMQVLVCSFVAVALSSVPVAAQSQDSGAAKPPLYNTTKQKLLDGKQVTTLEGLGTIEAPAPIQRAFMEEQAAQCGYCIAGMMMRAQALLQRNPKPTDAQIRAEMEPNLCRCGTHMRILAAVRRAAGAMGSAEAGSAEVVKP